MFAGGLSEPLRKALVDIGRYVPPLLKTIQGKNNLLISYYYYYLQESYRQL
jgi:hypothetical protein